MTNILAAIANQLPNSFFTLFSVKVMNRAIELDRINWLHRGTNNPPFLITNYTTNPMPVYYSETNGCVYAIDPKDPNILLYTPLSTKNTFNGNLDTWIEVDFMLMLDEEAKHQEEADYALKLLSSYYESYKADQ